MFPTGDYFLDNSSLPLPVQLLLTAVLVPQWHVSWWDEGHRKQNQSRAIDTFPFHSQRAPSLPRKEAPSPAAVIYSSYSSHNSPRSPLYFQQVPSGISPNPSEIAFLISIRTFLILKRSSWSKQIRSLGFVYIGDFTGASTY